MCAFRSSENHTWTRLDVQEFGGHTCGGNWKKKAVGGREDLDHKVGMTPRKERERKEGLVASQIAMQVKESQRGKG